MGEKRGQSWSLDVVLAVVVFILIIAIFYTLLSTNKGNEKETLQTQSQQVANQLDSETGNSQYAIIYNGSIDKQKIEELYNNQSKYDEFKKYLGISGDFCIFLVDQNGNLIVIDNRTGFGNPNLTIGGRCFDNSPCGCGQICNINTQKCEDIQ